MALGMQPFFDDQLLASMSTPSQQTGWVNSHGDPIDAGTGPTAVSSGVIRKVVHGDALQTIDTRQSEVSRSTLFQRRRITQLYTRMRKC